MAKTTTSQRRLSTKHVCVRYLVLLYDVPQEMKRTGDGDDESIALSCS